MNIKVNMGFTLLEIVISMLILSVVSAGAWGMMVTSSKLLNEAKHRLQAVNQASSVMERLRIYVSENPDNPVNAGLIMADGPHDPAEVGMSAGPISGVAVDTFNYEVTGNVSGTDSKKVTVLLRWNEG